MTTWNKVDDITTTYVENENKTYYGQRTTFNQLGITFNDSGIRFNNWFTTSSNRDVIYTDVGAIRTTWSTGYEFEEVEHLLLEDGFFLLTEEGYKFIIVSGQETNATLVDWNNVNSIHTTWI